MGTGSMSHVKVCLCVCVRACVCVCVSVSVALHQFLSNHGTFRLQIFSVDRLDTNEFSRRNEKN